MRTSDQAGGPRPPTSAIRGGTHSLRTPRSECADRQGTVDSTGGKGDTPAPLVQRRGPDTAYRPPKAPRPCPRTHGSAWWSRHAWRPRSRPTYFGSSILVVAVSAKILISAVISARCWSSGSSGSGPRGGTVRSVMYRSSRRMASALSTSSTNQVRVRHVRPHEHYVQAEELLKAAAEHPDPSVLRRCTCCGRRRCTRRRRRRGPRPRRRNSSTNHKARCAGNARRAGRPR